MDKEMNLEKLKDLHISNWVFDLGQMSGRS